MESARRVYKRWRRHAFARTKNIWGRRHLRRAGILDAIEQFQRARPDEAFGPDYDDLWFLWRAASRATTVLEFGGGVSTAVLAAAVARNNGHIWSLDPDERWAASTKNAMPAHLRGYVTTIVSAALPEDRDVAGWIHQTIPDIDPDFVYLDSPPLEKGRGVAFDLLDIEHRFAPGTTIVVDGRVRNARYLERNLRRTYRVRWYAHRTRFDLTT